MEFGWPHGVGGFGVLDNALRPLCRLGGAGALARPCPLRQDQRGVGRAPKLPGWPAYGPGCHARYIIWTGRPHRWAKNNVAGHTPLGKVR